MPDLPKILYIHSPINLFPTVCDVAGVERLQGESLLPLVNGEDDGVRDAFFAEKTYHAAYEPQRCVPAPIAGSTSDASATARSPSYRTPTTDRARSCCSRGEREIHPEQLYDVVLDPNEAHNLAGDPAHAGTLEELREKLEAWMVETKDPLLDGDVLAPEGAERNDPDGLSPNEPTIVT